jgi:hypothetical protein
LLPVFREEAGRICSVKEKILPVATVDGGSTLAQLINHGCPGDINYKHVNLKLTRVGPEESVFTVGLAQREHGFKSNVGTRIAKHVTMLSADSEILFDC